MRQQIVSNNFNTQNRPLCYGLGTHHEDTPTREDALLLFRFVEDTLLWCFRKGIGC